VCAPRRAAAHTEQPEQKKKQQNEALKQQGREVLYEALQELSEQSEQSALF
jgi:hypothetical protein